MSINAKIKLAIVASVVALTAAAPAAIAQPASGSYHPEGGTIDGTARMNTEQGAYKRLVPVDVVPDSRASSYHPEGGPADATAGRQTYSTMHQRTHRFEPSDSASPAAQQSGLPKY